MIYQETLEQVHHCCSLRVMAYDGSNLTEPKVKCERFTPLYTLLASSFPSIQDCPSGGFHLPDFRC